MSRTLPCQGQLAEVHRGGDADSPSWYRPLALVTSPRGSTGPGISRIDSERHAAAPESQRRPKAMSSAPQVDLRLFLAHRARLIALASRVTGSRSAAEDVVQEAYLRLMSSPPIAVAKPVAYLSQIVRNLATDWLRHAAWERPEPEKEDDISTRSELTPERIASDRAELSLLAAALSELPERTRHVFELNRLQGYTLEEIKREVGISVTVAHDLVQKARCHCCKRLGIAPH